MLVVYLEWIFLLLQFGLLLLCGKRASILVALTAGDIKTLIEQSLSLLVIVELFSLLGGEQSCLAVKF